MNTQNKLDKIKSQSEKMTELIEHLNKASKGVTTRINDYHIVGSDFSRTNPTESKFKRVFHQVMLAVANNQCQFCGSKVRIEVDHYLFAKKIGGNFIMKKRGGALVCNAVPLCMPCNRSKSSKKYTAVTTPQIHQRILAYLHVMSDIINRFYQIERDKGTKAAIEFLNRYRTK